MSRLALLALIATPTLALAEEPMVFTYLEFENSVPHIDLAVCPAPLAGPARFCRLTTHAEQLNVFVFSEEGDQPLIAFRSWPADLLVGLMD
jgi:hypothetical protein